MTPTEVGSATGTIEILELAESHYTLKRFSDEKDFLGCKLSRGLSCLKVTLQAWP
jgi:hypothetical protein